MNESSVRLTSRLFFFLLLIALATFAVPAFAANVTISGTTNFSSLDGGPDDADHAVNGVFTVTGDLTINGVVSCNGPSGPCPMSFNVGHDLTINAGGAVLAENTSGTGSGGAISFTVGHDFVMHGPTTTLLGAIVSSESRSSSSSNGGNITANVANAVTLDAGSIIGAGSFNAVAGNISVVAGGHIDADGFVLAGGTRTGGSTANQVGGSITIQSTSFLQPGVTVGSNAVIASVGDQNGAGTVTLEGCGVIINGAVSSTARKDAHSRVVVRSGKTIDIDGRDVGVTGATLGRNGRIAVDAPTGTAINHNLDLFAFGDITILGPAPASSSQFVLTGAPGVHDAKSDGATMRFISLTGGITASGNVLADGHTASGDDGGNITISAKSNINLDHAVMTSVGDSSTSNPARGGGTITIRSYSGNVVWTNGTGDVRPTGSGSGLAAGAQGAISITACGSITLSGSTFPTNGPPVGVFPGQVTSACTPAAPALPAGEPPLPVCCNVITITNPSVTEGTAGAAFSQTFTQTGAIGTATFSLASGTLPAGLTLSASGVLSGTPTVIGNFPIVVQVVDSQGCTGIGTTYPLHIGCQTITVNNPAVNTAVAGSPFSVTFTASNTIGATTFSTSSALPAGLSLSAGGVLSGTPTVVGTFPIVVTATDANGCSGSSTYTLTITCQSITVTNPATTSGTANTAFSATFTQSGGIGATTFSTTSTLPAGLTLSAGGVLSGTPTQTGSFAIVVKATDANGCQGTGATYTLTIACQTITVNNPAANSGTVNTPFSATFTATNTIGTTTFTTASALPAGLSLSAGGVLSGTPAQTGSFSIVVTATDGNGCSGTGPAYTLTIACQVITVNNPATTSGTAGQPFSATFTASNAVGTTTFSTASALPAGLSLSASGVLSGTPTVVGTFPIVVTATDANGCSGTGGTYNLTIQCQTITVTNPAGNSGVAGSPFSATFTQSGAIGGATFSTSSTLPAGLTLSAGGVLSGTPTQTGSFPIVVTVTDGNGCTGSGATYNLTIQCQVITVTNPANNHGVAGSPFSATFTQSGAIGSATFSTASALPAGIALSTSGVLSGTPVVVGTFPIVVTVTDANGCSGSGATYNLVISCQTISVINPSNAAGTVGAAFSETFSQSGAIGSATFSTGSALPSGLTLSASGVLSGTPTVPGTFPIVVTVTDANGCSGSGATYNLVIACQTITVTNPTNVGGTVGAAFSEQFTQSGASGTATFSTASTLPVGLTLSASGLLSGTPLQSGTFPIVVTVTDSNGCTGSGPTYTLVIACNVITVTNPGNSTGTAGQAFSATFTQSGGNGSVTWSESGALPSGITLNASTGVLSGTTTQTGSFPITVTATDANGCSGSSNYTLTIGCQTITITSPGVSSGTAGQPFSVTFTATGILGTATWTETGGLPGGIILSPSGVLSGTTSQTGTYNVIVKVTDSNGCFATTSYVLTINCQTVSVTNPAANSATAGVAFSATFTASGILGTATWSESGTLPSGVTLNASTGVLSGTPTQSGTFTITVTATDSNGCSGSGASYTLTVVCPTITVSRTGGGAFPAATFGVGYSGQSFTASGSNGTPYSFAVTGGSFPPGLSLSGSGAITGAPAATGTFSFTVTATDSYGCSGSGNFTIAVRPAAVNDAYANLVNNTQAVVGGGLTATPATPAVVLTGSLLANDQPAGSSLVAGTFATTGGGSVTIAADGTFLYTPPLAFLVGDSFTYTISSDTGGTGTPTSATGTVTLSLANRVWYINPNAALNGNGQSQSPWNKTSSIGATLAGDIFFVYDNGGVTVNTNAKITLLANQQLIGQGVTLIVNGNTLVAATSAPTLTATGLDVVAVNNGNTIAGVTLTNGTNNLITGSATNGLTVKSSTLNASVTANGLNLTNATGSIAVQNTTVSGSGSGDAVKATGGSANWLFTSSPVSATSGRAVEATSITGTLIFDAGSPVTVSAGTTDGAISLSSNSGTITFNKVTLTVSGTARAFVASNSGTVNVLDPTSTISTADGLLPCGGGNCSAAADLSGTTLGMKFKSVSANGSHGNMPVGLSFNTTAGSFQVLGDGSGSANGSGGSISGATSRAVYLLTASGTYTFQSLGTTLSAASANGWYVDNSSSGSGSPTVNVTGCTFLGVDSASQTKALFQAEAAGTASAVVNVQNSYFNNSHSYGFFTSAAGTSTMNVTVNQSGFGTNVNTGSPVNNPGTTVTSPNAIGMAITNSGSAQVDYTVTNDTFWGSSGARGAVFAVTISGATNTASSHLNGSFSGNKIGKSGVLSSGCASACGGIGLLPGTAGTFKATVQNNDVRQVNSVNLQFANTVSGSTTTAIGHLNNNVFAEVDTTGGPVLRAIFVSLGNSSGASVAGCVEVNGNTIVGPGWSAGSWIRFTNANNTLPVTLPGLTPLTGATAAQVNAYLQSQNTFTGGTGTDVNATLGTAGINGGSPCP